jgi:hypothetical protein
MGFFLFSTAFRTPLGPTHPPVQWVAGALTSEIKRPGRVSDRSPPSRAEVNNAWSYTPMFPIRLQSLVLNSEYIRQEFCEW